MADDTLNINYTNSDTIVIPSGINRAVIKNINIGEGFKILARQTFNNFSNLVNLNLPNSLEDIRDSGFEFNYLLNIYSSIY